MTEIEGLILNNQGLVYHVAHKFKSSLSNYRVSFEDVVGEGMIGLVKAAKKFEPERGFAFATFASLVITNEILLFLRKQRKYMTHRTISLDAPIKNGDGEEFYIEIADPIDRFELSEDREAFKRITTQLSKADLDLMIKYYSGVPQRVLAEEFNLSQSYISRIVSRTVRKAQRLVDPNKEVRLYA